MYSECFLLRGSHEHYPNRVSWSYSPKRDQNPHTLSKKKKITGTDLAVNNTEDVKLKLHIVEIIIAYKIVLFYFIIILFFLKTFLDLRTKSLNFIF